jgi:hypothetical protein
MSDPHEPAAPRESLVRAQFAPDNRRAAPDRPAHATLYLDNHDTVGRLVWVELGGPLARFTKPHRQPRMELQSRRQRSIPLKIQPNDTQPEGDLRYDLTAVVIDDKDHTVLYTTTLRVEVEAYPQVNARAEPASPAVVTNQNVVRLRVHVRNTGNVPLTLDSMKFPSGYWVRAGERREGEKKLEARRLVKSERSGPRTPIELRPGQKDDFDLMVTPPRYLIGVSSRTWQVPVGIRGDRIESECVFVPFGQKPRMQVERRLMLLGIAVAAALLVLIVLMAWLATR